MRHSWLQALVRIASISTLASSLALEACLGYGSDQSHPTGPTNSSTMSAVIDGKPWSAAIATATSLSSGAAVSLFGSTGAGTPNAEAISISAARTMGDQSFTPPHKYGQLSIGTTFWSTVEGGSGTITIDSLSDKRIVGRFEFFASAKQGTIPSNHQVTSGHFAINY